MLSIDWLGSAGCSTAPAAGESFPFVATEDQASALAHCLDAFGIDRVHALVGSSYGGMVGLQFAARYGDRLDRLCVLAAAERSHAQASAWRAVQRGVVAFGQRCGHGREALALARALAMTTYRSPEELAQRFALPAAVEGWLHARGSHFAQRFGPEQFLCLNESIDRHRVDPAAVLVPTTLVAFSTDQLVPPGCSRRLAAALPKLRRLIEVPTPYGHDGFLKATAAVTAIVTEVLS